MKTRTATAIATVLLMGFTQWLIDHGIYDPNAPHGQPTPTATAIPTPETCAHG